MTTPTRLAATAALALALSACGQSTKSDAYLRNVPEVAALTLDTSAAAPAGVAGAVDPLPVTTLGDDLAVVHAKAQAMNDALRSVFAHLDALTSTGGTELPGDVKQWGPAIRCVEPAGAGCAADGEASLLVRARRWDDHLGDFVVLARPAGSTALADFRPVLAGFLRRGAMDRRGRGNLWVNHENLHAAAAGFRGRGYLAAGFDAGPVAKWATYRMLGFTRDAADVAGHPAITATFTGFKNAVTGVSRARVAGLGNLDTTGAAEELGFWRAAWAPALGGRAFTVITNVPHAGGTPTGDVPAGKYWFARACYAAGASTPVFKEWYLCDRATEPTPRACLGSATRTVVIGSPSTTWADTACHWNEAVRGAEPEELRPPGLDPRDANDDRDEDGAAHTGLSPEGCPSTANPATIDPTPPERRGMGGGGFM